MIGILRSGALLSDLFATTCYAPGSLEQLSDNEIHFETQHGKASPGTGFHKRWLLKKRISATQKSQK